jgi:hypothetical protein
MQILEKSNEILNKIQFVKDKDKNLIDVYKTINYSIEDSNILIHLEGIKILENICRLINEFINRQKLKLLSHSFLFLFLFIYNFKKQINTIFIKIDDDLARSFVFFIDSGECLSVLLLEHREIDRQIKKKMSFFHFIFFG